MIKSSIQLIVACAIWFVLAAVVGLFIGKVNLLVPALVLAAILVFWLIWLSMAHIQAAMWLFIFSLPFERLPSIQYGGATIRISQIILLCMILGLLWQKLATRNFTLRLSGYFFLYVLFLMSLFASFWEMQAIGRGVSVLIYMIFTSLIIWVLPAVVTSPKMLRGVMQALFITTILISLFGIYQYIGDTIGLSPALTGLRELYTKVVFGYPRVQATELEPLYLANYLLLPIGLAIALIVRHIKKFSVFTYAIVIALGTLVMIMTFSRGGYLGFGVMVLLIILSSSISLLRPRVLISSAIIGVVLVGVISWFVSFSNVGQKSITLTVKHFTQVQQDASALFRLNSYGQALKAFDQSPITGVGIGNFGPWVAGYPNVLPIDGWAIVNNGPLEILAETGLVGMATTILFMAVLLYRSFTALRKSKDTFLRASMIGLLAALFGVIAQYQFFSTFYIMHIWTLFALIIALQNMILRPQVSPETKA